MHPGSRVRRGAAWGIVILVSIIIISSGLFIRPGLWSFLDFLSGVVFVFIITLLIGLAAGVVLKIISILPRFLNWIGLTALAALLLLLKWYGFPFAAALLTVLIVGLGWALLGGAVALMTGQNFRFTPILKKIFVGLAILVPVAMNVYIVYWMADRGSDKHLVKRDEERVWIKPLDAKSPAFPGPYEVLSLTYGSGTDKRRPEFGEEAKLLTEPVEATPFIKNNKGWRMKLREWYWGFDFKKFPVNGRVWYPDGEGPFPLVLIVHGNHKMEEYSDPGYAYLGQLLASRGFILVSVDENFFNGSWISHLSKENDGRGWMLLKHLGVWREWNQTEGHPFFHKVDMENIGLIGHSRGGEAAAIAGALNRLSHYPDDAMVKFDFGFNIKAIVAIAPSDGQYKPAGRDTPLKNVNYLVLQGAHDADVAVFAGIRQFNRVKFNDGKYWFKASIYSYRSNHGQFNTVWGDTDFGWPLGVFLNRQPLLEGEEQRTISKVYITAFLEATLRGKHEYIPLFRDHRLGSAWLPEDIYINRFEDSTYRFIADYEEDVDVTTAAVNGARILGENLAVWREADLSFRTWGTKENNVVYVGWRESESKQPEPQTASYAIEMPTPPGYDLKLNQDSRLVFTIAEADEKPPELEEKDGEKNTLKNKEKVKKEEDKEEEEGEKKSIDLSVELASQNGVRAKLPLSRFMLIPPVLKSRFTKLAKEPWYGKAYEPTMQTFELPLFEFVKDYPGFDPGSLQTIRFVFDHGSDGVIILDNIGLAESSLPAAARTAEDTESQE